MTRTQKPFSLSWGFWVTLRPPGPLASPSLCHHGPWTRLLSHDSCHLSSSQPLPTVVGGTLVSPEAVRRVTKVVMETRVVGTGMSRWPRILPVFDWRVTDSFLLEVTRFPIKRLENPDTAIRHSYEVGPHTSPKIRVNRQGNKIVSAVNFYLFW